MFISSRIADSFDICFKVVRDTESFCCEDYTFLLVQQGGLVVTSARERSVLSRESIMLLSPGLTYALSPLAKNQVFCFQCRKNFIEGFLPAGSHIECNSTLGNKESYRELLSQLERIGILAFEKGRENALIAAIYSFVDLLLNQFLVSPPAEEREADNMIENRVEKIRQYIGRNYHLPIFLQTLADEMYLSPQYLSKFIKQNMGITFNKYLNTVRLEHAFDELMHTGHTITEIAFNNGFSNTSAFNKQFRDAYGHSPTSYRKRHAQAERPAAGNAIPEGGSLFGNSSPSPPVSLHISYGSHGDYYPSWRDTINIGALVNAFSQQFHDSFKEAQQKIGFKYVRFYNIFDDEVIRYIPQIDDYSFTTIDMIFDFFREIHIIPFIEICYKPHKISLTTQYDTEPEVLFAKEKPLPRLTHALDALICHFISRYSLAEVSQWRFEIWTKHDEALRHIETPEEYWDKFQAFHRVVKSHLPDAAVGGPGYNTSDNTLFFRKLLTEMSHRQICPDFFSIYAYCYAPLELKTAEDSEMGHITKNLSMDIDYISHTYDTYRHMINTFAPITVPLYVTEFNSGLNGFNHVAASAFQAAFIVRNALALFQKTTCFAYWHFSDISTEILIGAREYATGMGLIEQHGIPNPGFFAYILLAKLDLRLAQTGSRYIAATDGRAKYQLLVSNYRHYCQSYCFTYQNRLGIANTYDVFDETDNQRLLVTLTDVPPGQYKCKLYILNRTHGCLIDKFLNILNYGKISSSELEYMLLNMSKEEADYYMKCAIPRIEISYLENRTGTLTFSREMQPHEVLLIHLELQF